MATFTKPLLIVQPRAGGDEGQTPARDTLLPANLTDDHFDTAPVLDSIDSVLIEERSVDEDDAFAAALES